MSSEDRYYLELKTEDRMLIKRKKKKDIIYEKIMFIYIEYSLQEKYIHITIEYKRYYATNRYKSCLHPTVTYTTRAICIKLPRATNN